MKDSLPGSRCKRKSKSSHRRDREIGAGEGDKLVARPWPDFRTVILGAVASNALRGESAHAWCRMISFCASDMLVDGILRDEDGRHNPGMTSHRGFP